ncbi:MAG TPA: hypothetical protein VEX41_09425 [Candidatus Eisenbacteria bacterium]|nr:hypothetical protein [Candidatus Eisenbacteria bacterium]
MPQAPQVPKEAPEGLRKFIACEANQVTLENGTLSWLSVSGKDVVPPDVAPYVPDKILNGTVHPGLTITPDPSSPGKAEIKIGIEVPGLGTVGPSIPASVENGTLTADTSGLPKALKDPIDSAIKNLNDWFKANRKGFGPPTFAAGKTTLTKIDLAPPPAKTTPEPTLAPGPDTVKPPPPPPPPVVPPEPQAAGTDWSHLTPTPEQWDKALQESKTQVSTNPPPLVGAGGPGGPKSPSGLADLGRQYLVGLVIAAIVVAGGFVFIVGPAVGLFGAAPAGATPTPAPAATPEPTPAPTPTPTPAGAVVRSDDGLVELTVPNGAVPPGTSVSIAARGQADAPPELAGVTFRSSFYDVMPGRLQFAMPATFERTVDVTKLGFDFEAVGYPVISLALRDSDAAWSWLGGQSFGVGGLEGLGPENVLVQAAQLDRTGDVFGFGGQLFVQLVSYPESGASLLVGQPTQIVVKVTAPSSEGTNRRIISLEPFASLPGIVDFGAETLSPPADGIQTAELSLTCQKEGELVAGFEMELTPGVSSALLDQLGLGQPPATQVTFSTSIHCVDTLPAAALDLLGGCVAVVHTPLEGGYPSHLQWRFDFDASPPPVAGTTLELAYAEGASSIVYDDLPIAGTQAAFDTGITQYGTKTFQRLVAHAPDGTATDLTNAFMETFGSSANVTSSELNLAGNRCGG